MALSERPSDMREEILVALELQGKSTRFGDELIDGFVGSDYQEGRTPDIESHENHNFEVVANVLPHLVWDNPKVALSSSKSDIQRVVTAGLGAATNWWIEAVDLAETLSLLALDSFFGPACAFVTMAPPPGLDRTSAEQSGRLLPKVHRVCPKRAFMDPQANHRFNARFQGHYWIKDKADLLKATNPDGTPRYDRQAVMSLKTDSDLDRLDALPEGIRRVNRDQVVGYEYWSPERNKIYTLAFDNSDRAGAVFLRRPRPAVCPPWGPYTWFGVYAVPDQLYPLPLLAVTKGLLDELNAHLDAVSEQSDKCRSFTLVNATNDKMVEAIKLGRHGDILGVPGFDNSQLGNVTIDGPAKEQLDYVDRLRMRLDRKSGITQTIAGNLTGVTKGEVDEAQARADVRIGFMQRQFRRCVKQLLSTAVWHLVESNYVKVDVELSEQAQTGMGTTKYRAQYIGGRDAEMDPEEPFDYSALQLTIEPFTMEYTDQRVLQANMQAAYQLTVEAAQMMPALPYVRWGPLLDDLYQTLNIRDGRKYIDWEMLDFMMQRGVPFNQPTTPPGSPGEEGAGFSVPMLPSRRDPAEVGAGGAGGAGGPGRMGQGAPRQGQRQLAGRSSVQGGLRSHPATT